eukprot:GHVQ01012293.1.p1 GENE.GHVQ01012293.1~~GHVQ01012293.1.p1  ORF type:complete len:341 (+),score=24.59 GHVQ01012293.1:1801-2823(+)
MSPLNSSCCSTVVLEETVFPKGTKFLRYHCVEPHALRDMRIARFCFILCALICVHRSFRVHHGNGCSLHFSLAHEACSPLRARQTTVCIARKGIFGGILTNCRLHEKLRNSWQGTVPNRELSSWHCRAASCSPGRAVLPTFLFPLSMLKKFTVPVVARQRRPVWRGSRGLTVCSAIPDDGDSKIEEDIQAYRLPETMARFVRMFSSQPENAPARSRFVCSLGSKCHPLPQKFKVSANKVEGCQSTVHIVANARKDPNKVWRFYFYGDSDGLMTKGLLYILISGLSGCTLEEIRNIRPEFGVLFGIQKLVAMSRINGFMNMLMKMKMQVEGVNEAIGKKYK